MNSTTLRGVFPEPKPVHKRNFIKENMKYIKQMQGVIQDTETNEIKSLQEKHKNKPMKLISRQSSINKSQLGLTQASSQTQLTRSTKPIKIDRKKPDDASVPKLNLDRVKIDNLHRGTNDTPDEVQRLYKNGVIRYPTPGILHPNKKFNRNKETNQDRGDNGGMGDADKINENMHSLEINERHNYIKDNIMALKNQKTKHLETPETKQVHHPKGSLPKYIRDRKEELAKECNLDPDCPEGHVLLPDEERKETLRVLRQSYADRIQELNSMPVRSDTLKMRKRKMALEEELKKIDEGIKVFQRPKVFVKINA
ncbi:hypothetical protein FQR65_LT02088 [Abscondita terminalis]|nr:hypothetical protein FQR65_LT02088 [Abscondita terminalis]